MKDLSSRVHHQAVAGPGLVPEDHNSIVLATKPAPTTAIAAEFNQSILTFPMQKQEEIPMEDLLAVVNATSRLQEEFARRGGTISAETAAGLCVSIMLTNKANNADLDKERRGYIYDSHQRNIDRSIKERQHHEKLSAGREDHDWLSKLRSEYAKALKALGNSIALCIFIYLAGCMFMPLFKILQFWQQASLQELMCGDAQVETPVTIDYSTYYLGMFWNSYYSNVSKVNTVFACFNFRASQFYDHVGILLATIAVPWVLQLVVPFFSGSERAVTSVVLVVFFCYEDWIPDFHAMGLGLCLCPFVAMAWGCLRYQYGLYKRSFGNSPPSVAQVSECTVWFAEVATALYIMSAIFGFVVWGLMTMVLGM